MHWTRKNEPWTIRYSFLFFFYLFEIKLPTIFCTWGLLLVHMYWDRVKTKQKKKPKILPFLSLRASAVSISWHPSFLLCFQSTCSYFLLLASDEQLESSPLFLSVMFILFGTYVGLLVWPAAIKSDWDTPPPPTRGYIDGRLRAPDY